MSDFKQLGFTLIELSIVLIIIGLITAGVIAGQRLIQTAQNQKIIEEIEVYQSVFEAFSTKYHSLPGDMIDATVALPNGGTTSNGTGNGIILWDNSTTPSEGLLAWQHIELAEMLVLDGMPGAYAGNDGIVGQTIPSSSSSSQLGIGVHYGSSENELIFGANNASSHLNSGVFFSPLQAFSIDQKMDDGSAGSGNISGYGTACLSGGEYDVTAEGSLCYITIQLLAGS